MMSVQGVFIKEKRNQFWDVEELFLTNLETPGHMLHLRGQS